MKISLSKRRRVFKERYDAQDGQCENCGRFIDTYDNISNFSFAHWKTRNKFKDDEYYYMFSLVCRELHVYENSRSTNLEKHPCVRKYLDKYDIVDGFWNDYVKKIHGIELR